MAHGTSLETTATSTVLFFLVLLQAALVWEETRAAPAKRNDILAGTEFLSVFINGAMATQPPIPRRRGFRRGNQAPVVGDNVPAESRQNEASIYRISRLPVGRTMVAKPQAHGNNREEVVRFYPISQKTLDNRKQNLASLIDDLSTTRQMTSTNLQPHDEQTMLANEEPPSRSSNATRIAGNGARVISINVTSDRQSSVVQGNDPRREMKSRVSGSSRGDNNVTNGVSDAGSALRSGSTINNGVNGATASSGTNKIAGTSDTTGGNANSTSSDKTDKPVNHQKVIGVSVTSTVEATPYKVRVEHYDNTDVTTVSRPPSYSETLFTDVARETTRTMGDRTMSPSSSATRVTTSAVTSSTMTPVPARLVTEELSNIVSESNRSEFSVEEDLPSTSWQGHSSVTPRSTMRRASTEENNDTASKNNGVTIPISSTEPVEENYETPEEDTEPRESHEEPVELPTEQFHLQGRKASRHYDTSHYNRASSKIYSQPSKAYGKPARTYGEPAKVYSEPAKVYGEPERVYSEPARIYSEPAKVYGEPAKVYSEPAKVYGEPAKVYGEPEKVYSEPSKIYSEPAKIYSEPAKVYSQPAKVYGEPSKVYNSDGQPVAERDDNEEPDEQNYEVDESVSVGSNGNVHGPQMLPTEPPTTEVEDGHKVGYVVEGRNYRKYRVEERTPDGFIVGEYGVVSHDDGTLRGVRYTADGTINPRLIYDALMKFLAL